MKPLRFAVFSLTATSLLALGTACTSDTNPFDVKTTITKTEPAKIQLHLNVAATRADMSTDAEKKINSVSLCVFNEEGKLEIFLFNQPISGDTSESIEVTSGMKTIYAVSGNFLRNPTVSIEEGMSLSDFEDNIFESTLSVINGRTQGFTMVGKTQQMIYPSVLNNVSLELVRLAAKTQLKIGAVNTEDLSFSHGDAYFYVAQTCNRMRLLPNGTDVLTYSKHTDGTFDEYTRLVSGGPYYNTTGAFTADGCAYLSENIVKEPKAGNTTFLILAIQMNPQYNYVYNQDAKQLTFSPISNSSSLNAFYAIGIIDAENGHEDFVMDVPNKRIVTFTNKTDAENYVTALNGGAESAMTVSELDSPMLTAATRASDSKFRKFEAVMFSSNTAYYRINITDADGTLRVDRNTFYKVTVNSIKSLGCHDMDLLYPTDPESDYTTPTSAMLGVKFRVAEWDEVDQEVDLD